MTYVWIPDNSSVEKFRENPEAFRLAYRRNLVPATPDDKMTAGSAIHAGLNALRCGLGIEDAVAQARKIRGDGVVRDADHVERIVRAYAERYPQDAEPFKVLMAEQYMETRINYLPADANFAFCGIVDSVIEFPDGSVYAMDVKSTGAYLNEQWTEAMRLRDQFVGYVAMLRAQGKRCDGYYVDGIHMNDYVRKGETVPRVDLEKHFARVGPVGVPDWRVERWARDMQYTLAQIAHLDETRGPDVPWPMYQNWSYGKVDCYKDFYEVPAELHDSVANLYAQRVWSPREVAEGRAV